MKRFAAVLIVLALTLTGCSQTRQVENQAYVIVMGVDQTDEGGIALTVQMPKISGNKQSEDGTSGGSYLKVSVETDTCGAAMEKLSRVVPRTLNLSQLKLLILSEDFARRSDCGSILVEIARNKHLFASAQVVVAEGSAQAFAESMEPIMGSRLSNDIDAMLNHFIEIGSVPDSRLADFCYLTESIYSDPMTIHANIPDESEDIQHQYAGCALFSSGRMVGELDGDEAVLANLLCGSTGTFRYRFGDTDVNVTPIGNPGIVVETDCSPAEILIHLRLSVNAQAADMRTDNFVSALGRDILSVIRKTQQLRVEPFGFAEIAARSSLTIEAFQKSGWIDRYSNATVNITIDTEISDA